MTITMNNRTASIQEMTALLATAGNTALRWEGNTKELYRWMEGTLVSVRYFRLRKREKTVVISYLTMISGYTRNHVKDLIGQYLREGHIKVSERTQHSFPVKYPHDDVVLLAHTSEAYGHPNGHILAAVCRDMRDVHNDPRFVRLGGISGSHVYNLRETQVFKNTARTFTKTKRVSVPIGERRKPVPDGKAGYIRADSVHQGDRDGEKGVYHITLVDEVTQWTVLVCVPVISERYMLPALPGSIRSISVRHPELPHR